MRHAIESIEEEIHWAESGDPEIQYMHCHVIDNAEIIAEGKFLPTTKIGITIESDFGTGFEFDPQDKAERSESEQLHDYLIEESTEYFNQNGY